MIDQTIHIQVPCSPEDAFAFVADEFFTNHQRWDPAITELTQTSPGPIGVGTTGTEVRRFAGKQSADFRITELERPRRFAFTNTSGAFFLDRAYTFTPSNGGAQIRFTFVMRPRHKAMLVLAPILRRVISKQVAENIQRLRGILSEPVAVGR